MVYYFQESYESMGGDTIPSCNVITIFNDSDAKGNGATAWDEDEAEVIDYVLTTSLPFVELGATYAVGASSDSSNILVLQDIYTVDLVESYSKLLIANGFILNKALSEENDSYYLTKTLSDGAIITALLYYSQGNNFYFLYTPKTTEYSSWPTVVTDEIEEKRVLQFQNLKLLKMELIPFIKNMEFITLNLLILMKILTHGTTHMN